MRTRQRYPLALKRILQFEQSQEDVFGVIASEAKQSIVRHKQAWIASSLSLLAMTAGGCPYGEEALCAVSGRCCASPGEP
jgi:hypothetical protein